MSFTPAETEKLKELIREVVREELDRMKADNSGPQKDPAATDIDSIAEKIFDRYDDVFSSLA